jgi:hypothetical protein
VTDSYNPLDKLNLARSIERELLKQNAIPLRDIKKIIGAGVYVLYYTGEFKPYRDIAATNLDAKFTVPIYVGKAIPGGSRKGGLSKDASVGDALRTRLSQHIRSIDQVSNLDVQDFFVRHLVVDDIWIPLGENMLIETFKPLWNRALDGFGNNAPGRGRHKQYKSTWDTMHPGRKAFRKLSVSPDLTISFLEKRISDYLSGKPMDPLPKLMREQEEEIRQDSLQAANES